MSDKAKGKANFLFAEMHSDYPVDLERRHRAGECGVLERIWLPKVRKANMMLSNFIVGGDTDASGKTMDDVLENICYIEAEIEAGAPVGVATSVRDIERLNAEGKIALIYGMEGAAPLGLRLSNLYMLHKLGLRIIQPTWNGRNLIADGFADSVSGGGLSAYGRQFIEEMNRLSMVVDLSHLSPKGVSDVLTLSTAPVMASHSNSLSLCSHPRNISDQAIRAVAEKGGIVGLVFYPYYLRDDGKEATLDDVVRHLEHLLKVAGEDAVGLGPDYIHFSPELIHKPPLPIYPREVDEVDKLPVLAGELQRLGYKDSLIEKIFHRNFISFLGRVWED